MEHVQNLMRADVALPLEFSCQDSVSVDRLDTAQIDSLAQDEAYHRLGRLKMMVALIATLLVLAVSILLICYS